MILTKAQEDFLNSSIRKEDWELNQETGLVDVSRDVLINNDVNYDKLPVAFGKVKGYFFCDVNTLTTLEGCPYWVGDSFGCGGNKLTALKHAPKYIGRDAYIWNNPLQQLDWNPDCIGGKLYLNLNKIEYRFYNVLVPEIEAIIDKGIELCATDKFYYPYRDTYYKHKLTEFI